MTPEPESELGDAFAERIHKSIAGDQAALASLLEEAGLALHPEIARQIGPQYRALVEADDVLQVTFLEAFLRIREFVPSGEAAFRAWLRQIARNNVRDAVKELERDKRPPPGRQIRSGSSEDSYGPLVERLSVTPTTASRSLARSELQSRVEFALRAMPPDYEAALRLYEIEGLSGEEVAARMCRSHGAVRMLLARARACLADALRRDPHFASRA
jgi:RNA polymerase sigma-70 factor, ECF subfamily